MAYFAKITSAGANSLSGKSGSQELSRDREGDQSNRPNDLMRGNQASLRNNEGKGLEFALQQSWAIRYAQIRVTFGCAHGSPAATG